MNKNISSVRNRTEADYYQMNSTFSVSAIVGGMVSICLLGLCAYAIHVGFAPSIKYKDITIGFTPLQSK